jgi:NAD(P)-dependent dehydrogenase (short-subunit alcohol dehydrogenase family)/acyl carrier protein
MDELLSARREDRVAWRGGARYAARLVKGTLTESPEEPALRADRSFLITGGFGALGLATARMLVSLGARHVVLTGRSGGEGKQQAVKELESAGASVLCVRADVASAEDVARMMREIAEKMPPLGGVIHSAGVLDDGVLTQQSLARLRTAMDPKVLGAWNLHCFTQDAPLDFFVEFSSAASLLGSPGQANYAAGNAFLDALAHHRRALGMPALSVNWGAWGGGMAESAAARRRQQANGVEAIDPTAGLQLLSRMLGGSWPAQIGVFPVNWAAFGAQFRRGVPPLLENLVVARDPVPAGGASLSNDSWSNLPPADLEPTLRRLVRSELAAVLGVGDPARVPLKQGFFEIGMDSLMAVDLVNRLGSNAGLSLPANLAIDYPNVEALTRYLAERMTAAMTPVMTPGPAAPETPAPDLDSLPTDEIARLLASELQ